MKRPTATRLYPERNRSMQLQYDLRPKHWNVVVQKTRRSKRRVIRVGLTYIEATKALDQLRGQVYDNKIHDCGIFRRGRGKA